MKYLLQGIIHKKQWYIKLYFTCTNQHCTSSCTICKAPLIAPGIIAQYFRPLLGISTHSLSGHWSQTRENSSPELLQLVTVGCMFRYSLELIYFIILCLRMLPLILFVLIARDYSVNSDQFQPIPCRYGESHSS